MNIEKEASLEINRLKSKIVKESFTVSAVSTRQYNFEFVVSSGSDKLKVQIYFGKKGVKTILQGNNESRLYRKISSIIFGDSIFQETVEEIVEPEDYIGTDESGKGDFFGPLTVAAFYFNDEVKNILSDLGVKDSKLLSDSQINSIADQIKSIENIKFEVVLLTPIKYNELYDKFGNLNLLLNWAHSTAIEKLLEQVKTRTVITDKFSKKELNISVENNKSSTLEKINFIQTAKGERFVGVAAASILARNAMNQWFENQKQNGLVLPKGASSEVDSKARIIKAQFGELKFREIAKLHFKTLQKIKK